jgi:hypothetical protein
MNLQMARSLVPVVCSGKKDEPRARPKKTRGRGGAAGGSTDWLRPARSTACADLLARSKSKSKAPHVKRYVEVKALRAAARWRGATCYCC